MTVTRAKTIDEADGLRRRDLRRWPGASSRACTARGACVCWGSTRPASAPRRSGSSPPRRRARDRVRDAIAERFGDGALTRASLLPRPARRVRRRPTARAAAGSVGSATSSCGCAPLRAARRAPRAPLRRPDGRPGLPCVRLDGAAGSLACGLPSASRALASGAASLASGLTGAPGRLASGRRSPRAVLRAAFFFPRAVLRAAFFAAPSSSSRPCAAGRASSPRRTGPCCRRRGPRGGPRPPPPRRPCRPRCRPCWPRCPRLTSPCRKRHRWSPPSCLLKGVADATANRLRCAGVSSKVASASLPAGARHEVGEQPLGRRGRRPGAGGTGRARRTSTGPSRPPRPPAPPSSGPGSGERCR